MGVYKVPVILEPEEGGGYHAFCPLLKGCHSQGETEEEALANVREAIELYIESLLEDGEPIPFPEEGVEVRMMEVRLVA